MVMPSSTLTPTATGAATPTRTPTRTPTSSLGSVYGQVFLYTPPGADKKVAGGAKVTVGGKSETADESGMFSIWFLAPKRYTLTASATYNYRGEDGKPRSCEASGERVVDALVGQAIFYEVVIECPPVVE